MYLAKTEGNTGKGEHIMFGFWTNMDVLVKT